MASPKARGEEDLAAPALLPPLRLRKNSREEPDWLSGCRGPGAVRGAVEAAHGGVDAVVQPGLAGVGGALHDRRHGRFLGRREGREHVADEAFGGDRGARGGRALGWADADAQAGDLGGAQVLEDRLDATVAGRAAGAPQAQAAEGEVDLVVDHQHLLRRQAMALQQATRGEAAAVHVGLRLGEEDRERLAGRALGRAGGLRAGGLGAGGLRCCELDARGQGVALQAVEAGLPAAGQLLDHPEADVVASGAVLVSRVAQAQDQAVHASSVLPFLITSGSGPASTGAAASVAGTASVLACITETSTRSGGSSSATPGGRCRSPAVRCCPRCSSSTSSSIAFGMSPGRHSTWTSRWEKSSTPPSVLTP